MKTALILSDIHYPFQHKPSIRIAKKICRDLKPDYVVYLGDCFDASGISKYSDTTLEKGIDDTIKEIHGFKKLHEEFKLCAPRAKFYWTLGNHDGKRITVLLSKLRAKEDWSRLDYCEREMNLRRIFKDITFCDYNEYIKIGKLRFAHGEYCNDNSTKSHAVAWSGNLCYGHTHTYQSYTLKQKGDYPSQALTLGCLCTHKPEYMMNQSHGWSHCLGVVYFQDTGNYNLYPIQINAKKAIFNGKLYTDK